LVCAKAIYDAHERQDEPKAVIDEAEASLYALSNSRNCTATTFLARDGVRVAVEEIEAAARRGTGLNGPATGFPTIDREMCGLEPHLCAVIAALANVGKTQLALSMMKNMSEKGEPSAFVSLESTASSLTKRWLSMVSGVPLTTIRQGMMSNAEWDRFAHASDLVAKWPVKIEEAFGANINDMRGILRRLAKEGYKAVFVDYLSLIRGPEKENKTREIDAVSVGLAEMARRLPIALVSLVQVNREVEKAEREPRLSDLKDSGQIGQDADVVIMMHRKLRDDGRYAWDDGKLKFVKGRDP
jgi:replicative DNA helicase